MAGAINVGKISQPLRTVVLSGCGRMIVSATAKSSSSIRNAPRLFMYSNKVINQ